MSLLGKSKLKMAIDFSLYDLIALDLEHFNDTLKALEVKIFVLEC